MDAGDLADIEAIKQLKARYFRLMDTKDWDGLAGVFTPDLVIDTSQDGGGVITGVAEYIPFLRANIEEVVTVHHGHMPEITIESPTTARGIWAMEDKLWWPAEQIATEGAQRARRGSATSGPGSPLVHLHAYGHYHETYEKSDPSPAGEWRIKTLRLTRLRRDFVTD